MKKLTLIYWWFLLIATFVLYSGLMAGEDKINRESQFLSNIRQLTFEGKRAGEGYFSPDGNAIIFQSEREPGNPFFQIYILDMKTGDTHRVSTGIGKTTCGFFRPGTDEVIFASTHLDPQAKFKQAQEYKIRKEGKTRRYAWDYDEYMDIFLAHRDGSIIKRLTTARGYDAEGSFSPDGKKIVFCSVRDAYPPEKLTPEDRKRLEINPSYFGEIYIMNADGSGQRRLTDWPGYDGGPFFSPDGQRIIWRHFDESGMLSDIYTMKPDGSDIRRLTNFESMSWAPFYHPSGKYVIFTSNKFGFSNFELFIVDVQGKHEPVRITYTDGFDGLPAFSPDGKKLCWTSNRTSDGTTQLFLADWNHDAALAALESAPERSEKMATDPPQKAPIHRSDQGNPDLSNLSPEISVKDLQKEVGYLASDELEGRMTGSRGTRLASEYIARYFKALGLKPLGKGNNYFQNFEFTAGMKVIPEKNHMEIVVNGKRLGPLKVDQDFRPLSFTANGEIEGEVVFAGYGLKLPDGSYDSYHNLNVKDKIVLVLRYVPEKVDMKRRQELNMYAGLRYKAMVARQNGARALLVVTGPNSPNAGKLVPFTYDHSLSGSGIIAASISGEVAEKLFKQIGKDLKSIQDQLDIENPHMEGSFPLSGVKIKLTTAVERIKKTDRNVLALLPPSNITTNVEYVVVGAHYDHIGHGEIGSLAHKGEEGQIHNGADDNASGTATVLELAASLVEKHKQNPQSFKRGIIFALWSGEELGLIGSTYFVEHPLVSLEKIVAYVNFDMVGHLRKNKLILQGVASSTIWPKLIEKRNVPAGFNLTLQEDPYLPTDVTAFYPKGIPVLSFFTGSHENYNRPTDDPETLNYAGMQRIAQFAQNIILDLVKNPERPEYVKVERKKSQTGEREALRAYLGTIPDYVSEIEGVKLSGVRAGGPADKAGLKGGDIIVEFAGQKITNIYDYTYALDAVKIGQPVEVVVVRNGKRIKLTVIPEARK